MINVINRLSTERHEPSLRYVERERRWQMSFGYNDQRYVVSIDHNWGDDEVQYTVYVWTDGEQSVFETPAQRKARHDMQGAYDQDSNDDGYFTPSHWDAVQKRVEECLRRWDALKMIVCPTACS